MNIKFTKYINTSFKTIDLHIYDNDNNLSWQAKGLHTYLVSRPDDWNYYHSDLFKRSTNKALSTQNALNELLKFGYIYRISSLNDDKIGKSWSYLVFERPISLQFASLLLEITNFLTNKKSNIYLMKSQDETYLKNMNNFDTLYMQTLFKNFFSLQVPQFQNINIQELENHVLYYIEHNYIELKQLLKLVNFNNTVRDTVSSDNVESKSDFILNTSGKNLFVNNRNIVDSTDYGLYTPEIKNRKVNVNGFSDTAKNATLFNDNNIVEENICLKNNNEIAQNVEKIPKKLRYIEIVNELLEFYYKLVIIYHPKVKKEVFFNETEKVKIDNYLHYLLYGLKKNNFYGLKTWIKENKYPISDNFNLNIDLYTLKEKIKEICSKLFSKDYLPTNKDILDTRLSSFLINEHKQLKSTFLHYYFNDVKKIEVPKLPINQEIFEIYKKEIFNNFNFDLKSHNKLCDLVDSIVLEQRNIITKTITYKCISYTRTFIESAEFNVYVTDVKQFINNHINFLQKHNLYNNLNALLIKSNYWNSFSNYYKEIHDIDLYINDTDLQLKLFAKLNG